MKNFSDLRLKRDVVDVLNYLNYKVPTDVQEKIIPIIMEGRNVVFTSRTGSGKTLAFLLGFLPKINVNRGIQMVVLVPTRELCIQVGKEMQKICDLLNIKVGTLYGGREISGDYKTTDKKNQIIIGTPGRLLQHVNQKNIVVGEAQYLVYDESDQMFDDGFVSDCVYIKKRMSKKTQIVLSSATITQKVVDFMTKHIKDYDFFEIGDIVPKNIVQEKLYCEHKEKNRVLANFFNQKTFSKVLVFCNTKIKSESLTRYLNSKNFKARVLNSDLKQDERTNLLNLFKQGKVEILVVTDVAARGLHIEQVDIVVSYDVAKRSEFHIHRMGRTGRNDKPGYTLTLICERDINRFNDIKDIYDLKVQLLDHEFNKIDEPEPKSELETEVVSDNECSDDDVNAEDIDSEK